PQTAPVFAWRLLGSFHCKSLRHTLAGILRILWEQHERQAALRQPSPANVSQHRESLQGISVPPLETGRNPTSLLQSLCPGLPSRAASPEYFQLTGFWQLYERYPRWSEFRRPLARFAHRLRQQCAFRNPQAGDLQSLDACANA